MAIALGSDDDLSALDRVLTRLSYSLDSNRLALANSLERTDEIGADLPLGLTDPNRRVELMKRVAREKNDCAALNESLETIVSHVSVATHCARRVVAMHQQQEIDVTKNAGHDLLSHQLEVEKLADECTSLSIQNQIIDFQIAELLSKLRATIERR